MKKITINIGSAIVSQIVAIIYGFVLPRLILEQFGSEINGLTQSITQFLGIINFLDMGLGQVVCSSLYVPLVQHDSLRVNQIMASSRRFYHRIGQILIGYVIVLSAVYPRLVPTQFSWLYTTTLILVISINSFSRYFLGITNELLLHADQKNYLTYIIQTFCNLVSIIVCIWMVKLNCSIHMIKLMTATVFLCKPLIYAVYVRRHYTIDKKVQYSQEPIAQKWNGIAQHVSAVVLDGTDIITLTTFSSLTNVSVYSVCYMIISSIQSLYNSAITGIQSAVGALWAKQNPDEIRKMFTSVEFGLHTVTVFLFCCTGILIVPFVQVYTNGLTDANYIQPVFAALLVLAYGIRCLRTPYNIWILAAGHFKQTQRCHIIAAATNLILSILAVSQWGLVGIAVGTLIAMCYQTVWMAIYTTKMLVPCSDFHILKRYFVDGVSAVAICLCTSWIRLPKISYLGWLFMAIPVAVIAIVILAAMSALFYRNETMHLLRKLCHKNI